MKPHLMRVSRLFIEPAMQAYRWSCYGGGRVGFGETPYRAWKDWWWQGKLLQWAAQ